MEPHTAVAQLQSRLICHRFGHLVQLLESDPALWGHAGTLIAQIPPSSCGRESRKHAYDVQRLAQQLAERAHIGTRVIYKGSECGELDVVTITLSDRPFYSYYEVKGHITEFNCMDAPRQAVKFERFMHHDLGVPYDRFETVLAYGGRGKQFRFERV